MKRLVVVAAAVLAIGVAPAHGVTNTYSTGNVNLPIGATLERSLSVLNKGPVSFVRVSFRITAPKSNALAISLVSPKGTEVPLVTNRGAGADFGADTKDCGGTQTVVDSDETTNPIEKGASPFTGNPYKPEGNLASLYGQEAKGKWTLKVVNNGPAAHLNCLTLDISRRVAQTYTASKGPVRASVSFVERNYFFEQLRLKVTRAGRTAVDKPLQQIGCKDCQDFRPVAIKVRDLDGGEPEILVDLYTNGAHCCAVSLILRWNGSRYVPRLVFWGNYGMRLGDLDGDGRPELQASDERFIYAYTAYVFSGAPPSILHYQQGKLVDVTRDFPKEIEQNAAQYGKEFLKLKRPGKDFDARGLIAAYVADQYLLGRPDVAKKTLDDALRKGLLYSGKSYLGTPAGRAYIAQLNKDLRTWGYIK